MADPKISEVTRRVKARLRRVRPLDDYEEIVEAVMSAYRDAVKAWPWGFLLQRYRTRLLGPVDVTVTLTSGRTSITVVSSNGTLDFSLYPSLILPGRRPLFTDGGGNLVEGFIGDTGDYQGKFVYNIIPLFDVVFWGVSVTDVGPLYKMSFQALETLSPNRDRIGRPFAFVPYTPFCEIYPAPDKPYDLDVWLVPTPGINFDVNTEIAAPLVDAIVYKACALLLAQSNPQMVPFYMDMYEREMSRLKSVDSVAFSWPEFHLDYEVGKTLTLPNIKVIP